MPSIHLSPGLWFSTNLATAVLGFLALIISGGIVMIAFLPVYSGSS